MGGPTLNGLDAVAWGLIPTPWVHADPRPFEVAPRIRGILGEDPAVAEESFWDLHELFVGYYQTLAEAAPLAVPYLVEILAHEATAGRGFAGQLLAEIAALALRERTELETRCLMALHARRDVIDNVARSTSGAWGETARLVLCILDSDPSTDHAQQIERVSNLVFAEQRDCPGPASIPPGAEEIQGWMDGLRSGSIMEDGVRDRDRQLTEMGLYLATKTRVSDPGRAVQLLETRPPPPPEGETAEQRRETQVRWSLTRAELMSSAGRSKDAVEELDRLGWGYSTQALALAHAEHEPGSNIVPALLERITDPSLRVRRTVVEARHGHLGGNARAASRQIAQIAEEWLLPPAVHSANQVLDRARLVALLELVTDASVRDDLLDRVRKAPEPDLAIPDGDTL